jgi:hypothetical protein
MSKVDRQGQVGPKLDEFHLKVLALAATSPSGTVVGNPFYDRWGSVADFLSMRQLEKCGYLEEVLPRAPEEGDVVFRITEIGRVAHSEVSKDLKRT